MRASFFDDVADARSSPEGTRLRATVLAAYRNCPFRGKPFVLPGGVVVCEDTWEAALEVALDETVDQGLDALREFSLERWLGGKVRDDGDAKQKAEYEALIATFDLPPEPVDEGFRVGLPSDIYTGMVHQPNQEIEVYRGLEDLEVPEDVLSAEDRPPHEHGDGADDAHRPEDAPDAAP